MCGDQLQLALTFRMRSCAAFACSLQLQACQLCAPACAHCDKLLGHLTPRVKGAQATSAHQAFKVNVNGVAPDGAVGVSAPGCVSLAAEVTFNPLPAVWTLK